MYRLLLTFIFIFSLNLSFAQLEVYEIDGEGWAKGNLIEFGINSKGVYGANTFNRPASFHDNRENQNYLFGFIANPLNDGWIDYDGDFFTPGEPEEGFCIEIDGVNYNNNNGISNSQIPGRVTGVNIISSDCFEDIAQISWEGNVQGLNIKRYYSVTQDGLFIQMTTFIKNLTDAPKNDVYFMHNVDPDNNVTLSERYETDMELVSQASSAIDQTCLVTASQQPLLTPQDMDGSDVSFYANNQTARVTFGGFNNRSASQVWNGGPDFSTIEGTIVTNVDAAISIAFNIGDIEANETKRFNYYYILEKVDESFVPFIVNAIKENPSTCNGEDGKLIFSGLTEGTTYTISYVDDSVFVPEEDYVADANGIIEITNLNAGSYTNVAISFSGCATTLNTSFNISDPDPPNYIISKRDYTNCDNTEGQLIFSGLTPLTTYNVQYSFDGELLEPQAMEANNNGDIIITEQTKGIYTDFILEQYECITTSNEIVEIIGPLSPVTYPIPDQFYCDEDYDFKTTINLDLLNDFVIGPDNANDFVITYHKSIQDVINRANLPSENYRTNGDVSYELYVKKQNLSTSCFSYAPFRITVNSPPDFDIEDADICLNSDDTVNFEYTLPTINTGLSETDYSFEWFFEDDLLADETAHVLTASSQGKYSIRVTSKETGCPFTKEAIISASGPPKNLSVDVTSLPFSKNHTVEITASGFGEYIYSVDDGPTQESNIFMNLNAGYHIFKIIDTKGCGSVDVEKTIIGYMKYFTPNADSFNDYWQIIGVEALIEPKIYIFNRHGKILKQLNPNGKGWNGTFNGRPLPQSDYWFKVVFKDNNNIEREFLEHFTLKR